AARDQFADLISLANLPDGIAGFELSDLDLDARERPPDRSGLDAAMRIDDGEAARLGHAPAFDDLGPAGDFADFPERRDGNGRTANDEMLDGCDRPVGLDGARASKYGRHAGADGDPVAIYETPVIGDDL